MPSAQRSRTRARSPRVANVAGFRFDPVAHVYYDEHGARVPNITGMLEHCGYVDSEWFTEESRVRGTAVHNLTASYDLGGLHLPTLVTPYKGWLLAYIDILKRSGAIGLPFTWEMVEEALYHPRYRYGGRPDRVGRRGKSKCIVDIKSGAKEKWHRLQTALQAIAVAGQPGQMPAQYWERYALYVKEDGTASLDEHPNNRADLAEAHGIIDDVCGVAA